MKITIICVGKIKEDFYRKAVSEYEKRLSRYCRLEIIEVLDEKTPDHAGPALEEQIKQKEAERILKHIREDAYVITLEIQGAKPDSVSFANQLNQMAVKGTQPYPVCYRRFPWTASERFPDIRAGSEFFQYDIPPSINACYLTGADLPELPYHKRGTISQVKAKRSGYSKEP